MDKNLSCYLRKYESNDKNQCLPQSDAYSIARSIPMLVRVNGIYPTLLYLRSKKEESYRIFYAIMMEYLRGKNVTKLDVKNEVYHFMIQFCMALYLSGKDLKYLVNPNIEVSKELEKGIENYQALLNADNFKLCMDKYFPTIGLKEIKSEPEDLKYKSNIREKIKINKVQKYEIDFTKRKMGSISKERIRKNLKHKEAMIKQYNDINGFHQIQIVVKNDTNLLIGMGEASVREVAMKLDHVLGIPFIPASTVKGAFRNFMKNEANEKETYSHLITYLFGEEDNDQEVKNKGALIFWDVYPSVESPKAKLRVVETGFTNMTVEDNSVPIKVLAVGKGCEFKVNVTVDSSRNYRMTSEELHYVEESFKDFFDLMSLGSKKSVGYGLFKVKEEDKYDRK